MISDTMSNAVEVRELLLGGEPSPAADRSLGWDYGGGSTPRGHGFIMSADVPRGECFPQAPIARSTTIPNLQNIREESIVLSKSILLDGGRFGHEHFHTICTWYQQRDQCFILTLWNVTSQHCAFSSKILDNASSLTGSTTHIGSLTGSTYTGDASSLANSTTHAGSLTGPTYTGDASSLAGSTTHTGGLTGPTYTGDNASSLAGSTTHTGSLTGPTHTGDASNLPDSCLHIGYAFHSCTAVPLSIDNPSKIRLISAPTPCLHICTDESNSSGVSTITRVWISLSTAAAMDSSTSSRSL